MVRRQKSTAPSVVDRHAQVRDAEHTRASILDAAEEEFAQNGLAGARTEAIASRTGVTKAMLYYYFESKEGLYQAVLERAFADRIKGAQQISLDVQTPSQALEQFLNQLLTSAGINPNLPAILFYEAMQNKGKYYKQVGILSIYGALIQILEAGVKDGSFRNLDPLHTAVNIIGLCSFYFCTYENVKSLWAGKQMLSPEMIDQHCREAINMVMAGVRPA